MRSNECFVCGNTSHRDRKCSYSQFIKKLRGYIKAQGKVKGYATWILRDIGNHYGGRRYFPCHVGYFRDAINEQDINARRITPNEKQPIYEIRATKRILVPKTHYNEMLQLWKSAGEIDEPVTINYIAAHAFEKKSGGPGQRKNGVTMRDRDIVEKAVHKGIIGHDLRPGDEENREKRYYWYRCRKPKLDLGLARFKEAKE